MATVVVHRSNPGADIDQIVATLNALVDRVNELTAALNAHLSDGLHQVAADVDADLALVTATDIDKMALGY